MADEFPSRLLEKVVLRLPDGMRDRLKAEAEANKRSMNAEIVARLDRSLEEDGQLPKAELDMFYGMAAAVAEQTVTHMLHVWLNAAEEEGGTSHDPVRALRKFLADRSLRKSGEQPDQPVEPRKWSTQEIVEFARQLVAAQDGEARQEPDATKKAG